MKTHTIILSGIGILALVGALVALAVPSQQQSGSQADQTSSKPKSASAGPGPEAGGKATNAETAWRKLRQSLQTRLRSSASRQGQTDAARQMLGELKAFADRFPESPQSARALFSRAAVAEQLGKPDLAVKSLDEAMRRAEDPRLKAAIRRRQSGLSVRRGAAAPAFEAKTLDGDTVELADYRGQVVLLDFWATWCGPCVAEVPHLKELYKKHRDDGFEIISISLDRRRAPWKQFIEQRGMDWVHVYNGSQRSGQSKGLAAKFGVRGIPKMFVIGRDGQINRVVRGGQPLEKAIQQALNASSAEDAAAERETTKSRASSG